VKFLPLLWAQLFRRKTRTVLTVLSVLVAFLLFGLLEAVQVAFESGADSADAKRLLTMARYSIIEPLPMAYASRIERVPGVVGVAYADWFGAKYQNESNAFAVFAVDPARYLAMYPEFEIAAAQREAFVKTRTGAVAARSWRIATAGRWARSCPSRRRSTPRATAASTGSSTSSASSTPRIRPCARTPRSC